MAKKQLRIGLIGYGFMGRAHSNAYAKVGHFFESNYELVLQAVCGRDPEKVQAFADQWGYQSVETDWKSLIARDDIDVVDIAVPNNLHSEIALAAAKAGKMILCEKPLGLNGAEAEKMVEAVKQSGVPNMVWYNYRRCPAVVLAKQLIDAGRLGRIFHYRANFLQDWTISPDLPQGGAALWRLDSKAAGSGVTGDLLAHCIDTALWLNGGIKDVNAMTETFIKERPIGEQTGGLTAAARNDASQMGRVTVDDAALFTARFDGGAIGSFEATRFATGRKNAMGIEIYGSAGSLAFDFEAMNELHFHDHMVPASEAGFRRILVTDGTPVEYGAPLMIID
jgi:predicted dehydrogenase